MARICVPIIAKNVADAQRAAMRATRLGADLIEHRLDFIKGLSAGKVDNLVSGRLYTTILTNRRKEEGGHFIGTDIDRMNLLTCALNLRGSRPEYIDIELDTPASFRDYSISATRFCGSKAIISTHFMDCTPDIDELMCRYDRSVDLKADIVKIVTFAQTPKDNETIYRLIEKTRGGIPLIALAMGEFGRETRIKSVRMGAFLTFASLESGKESAPGQIPLQEMRKELEDE